MLISYINQNLLESIDKHINFTKTDVSFEIFSDINIFEHSIVETPTITQSQLETPIQQTTVNFSSIEFKVNTDVSLP